MRLRPRAATAAATFETLPDGSHLLVGKDIDELQEFSRRIKAALALSILLIFVLAGVASVSVTRRTVGRIESINATSRAIMQSGLGQRILLRGTRDGWDELAANLNSMLDRIEALMGEVKQVTDNVAHDLRTPLARMRGRLEKAYNMRRNGDYDQLLIGDTMADLEGVLRMFSSLTRISQIEAYDGTAAFRPVNPVEIAREVVELFEVAAEDKGKHLKFVGKRFYRLERSRRAPGNGLGLSLVAAVARLHEAHIKIFDNAPGLKIQLQFPSPTKSDLENRVAPTSPRLEV